MQICERPEFHLVATAALHLGATPFSIYNTSTVEQVAHQLANAGSRVVVTERHFLPVVRAAGAAEVVLVEELERCGVGSQEIHLVSVQAADGRRGQHPVPGGGLRPARCPVRA